MPGEGRKRPLRRVLFVGATVLIGIGVLAGGLLGAAFGGYLVATRDWVPADLFGRADRRLQRMTETALGKPQLPPAIYPSHLIELDAETVTVDFGQGLGAQRRQHGGGMISFGPDVVLLTFDGWLYAASGPDDLRRTRVAAPDNGRAAYAALADDPAYADYDIQPSFLRYNDLKRATVGGAPVLLASFTEFNADQACYTNALATLALPEGLQRIDDMQADPGDWTIVFRTDPCLPLKSKYMAIEGHMAGGRLAVDGSTVFLASSDYHIDAMRSEPPAIAQLPDHEYGKVIAVSLDDGSHRIVSSGHRNMQGIVLTDAGDLFVVEHGALGGDELNRVIDGSNYGWPLESFGLTYAGTRIPEALSYGRHAVHTAPEFAWVPSIAPSGMTVVEGFHPAWDGDLIITTLKDGALHRMRLSNGTPVYDERIPIGSRLRAVHQHTDGRLVVWTDAHQLVFLTAQDLPALDNTLTKFAATAKLSGADAVALRSAVEACAQCHSFNVDDHQRGPSMARIFGDPVAATPWPHYSDALKGYAGVWDDERLTAYLAAPQEVVPGTRMPAPGLDSATVDLVVAYLKALDAGF